MIAHHRKGQTIDTKDRREKLYPFADPLSAVFERMTRQGILTTEERTRTHRVTVCTIWMVSDQDIRLEQAGPSFSPTKSSSNEPDPILEPQNAAYWQYAYKCTEKQNAC